MKVDRRQRTFSATGSGWVPDPWKVSLRPAAGFNLNLLKFLYVQLNYQSAFVLSGTPTHTLSARSTTQLQAGRRPLSSLTPSLLA